MRSEKFLTRQSVAGALGHSIETLERWELNGLGPRCIRVGKVVAYRVKDVEVWVRDRLVSPAPDDDRQ